MTDEKAMALFGGQTLPAEKTAGALRALGAARRNVGDKAFMKFNGKTGEWTFGAEQIEIEEDELWAVNPNTFMVGVIGWEDGEVVDEFMYPITSGKRVDHSELATIPHGDGNGWSDQITVELRHMGDGTQAVFKTSSQGGLQNIAVLADSCGDRMETSPETPVPVVYLTNEWYKHKKKERGKIFKPVFKIDHWVDMEGHAEGVKRSRRNLAG